MLKIYPTLNLHHWNFPNYEYFTLNVAFFTEKDRREKCENEKEK